MFTLLLPAAQALTLAAAVSHGGALRQDMRPFVSPMFSDNMVLQRDMRDPVWGWAAPGTQVKVTFADKSSTATADKDGRWLAKIGPFKAGGPFKLTVEGAKALTFDNVLVGDVWICSGQSNMEFGIGNLTNADAEIASADYPTLRLFFQPKIISPVPLQYTSGSWDVCTPENVKKDGDWAGFSAVAYFFGRRLNEDLKVPIGLIHTSWGGTPAQAWTCEKDLADKLPEYRTQIAQVEAMEQARLHPETVVKDPVKVWYAKNDKGSATEPGWADPALDDSGWKTANAPGFFQDAGYKEFVNQQSVVWYRKSIDLPADAATGDATVHLMVNDNDETWVNGTKVGATDGYNIPRAYKVPSGVLHAGANVIAVRVTDTQAPGGIWGDPAGLYLQVGETKMSLAGAWKIKLGTAVTAKNPYPMRSADDPNLPTVLYNGMIQPIIPFAVKGAIWYQGESNAGQAYQYRTLLPTMINSWRRNWDEGDFPFLIVQLAGFQPGASAKTPGDDAWAELREAQWLTTKTCRNTGIATAFDIGEPADIHPKDKQDVGKRLALVAEAEDYHMKVSYSGPVYKSMKIEKGTIRLSFDHVNGGLVAKGDTLIGFAIAGADHKWYWADAKIDGKSVIVSSASVRDPVAVRYGWASYLDCTLCNKDDLPALPFRTDTWKGITGGP